MNRSGFRGLAFVSFLLALEERKNGCSLHTGLPAVLEFPTAS